MENNPFERDAIRNIQTYLRHLSYHSDDIPPVPIDGIWESATRDAILAFQRKNGRDTTGTVDRETWDLLKKQYDESVARNSPPAALELFPRRPADFSIGLGDRGFLVDTVQYLLEQLSRVYYIPSPSLSGEYDRATFDTVRDFQMRNNISPSGRVDRETWDAMVIQHNILLNYDE